MSMSQENQSLFDRFKEDARASDLAAECILRIDAAGGMFCSPQGVRVVAEKIMARVVAMEKKNL